ncbi:MAG: hypothetical protein NXI10_05525 [bacterium]|nr:hypothetical protein [bacterium]
MAHYMLSFMQKATIDPEETGSGEVVNLLINYGGVNLDSRIPGTIVFESSKTLSEWFEILCVLKASFYFHILPVAMPSTPEQTSRHSKGVRDAFLKEVEQIKSSNS